LVNIADLKSWEAEQLRRSVAMLPPEAPAGLGREKALAVLDQLRRLLEQAEKPPLFIQD
jgi:hypothetical protein